MTRKPLTHKQYPYPTVQSITQDVYLLEREALLELQAVIDKLLVAPAKLEAGAPEAEVWQASCNAQQHELELLALTG
jgi:hypothetical protein